MSDTITAADKNLLQSFVPINTLSLDHLDSLLRDRSIEVLCAGQNVFEAGECDNQHIYLLHGDVELLHADGTAERLSAESHLCTFPIAHVQPRQHSARAVTDCSVIRFDSAKIDGMIAWDQTANYIMLAIAAQRDLDEDAEWMATLLRSNLFYKVPPINIEQILHRFEQGDLRPDESDFHRPRASRRRPPHTRADRSAQREHSVHSDNVKKPVGKKKPATRKKSVVRKKTTTSAKAKSKNKKGERQAA